MTDQAVTRLAPQLGVRAACEMVGAAQARLLPTAPVKPATGTARAHPAPARRQPRALSTAERQAILDVPHSDRLVDVAPA